MAEKNISIPRAILEHMAGMTPEEANRYLAGLVADSVSSARERATRQSEQAELRNELTAELLKAPRGMAGLEQRRRIMAKYRERGLQDETPEEWQARQRQGE